VIPLLPEYNTNLEQAVACFRPILQSLKIRQGVTDHPVFLSSFPHLWNLNKSSKWVITVLKTKMPEDCRAKFVTQHHKEAGIMECYIIISDIFFVDAKVPNEIRKAVIVHEFCHFLALIYASASSSEKNLHERLKERLAKVVDELTNDQALKLYKLLNEVRPLNETDDFATFEQTRDDHFRLNCENLDLSYTDLFKNLLLSRQMIREFFEDDDVRIFNDYLQKGNAQEAINMYFDIVRKIAKEKWLPDNFAINQSIAILRKYGMAVIK